jgi:hypothetical protein
MHLSTNCDTKSRTAWVKNVVAFIQRDKYMDDAREMFFGKALTPTKCINHFVDGFKMQYEAQVTVNA